MYLLLAPRLSTRACEVVVIIGAQRGIFLAPSGRGTVYRRKGRCEGGDQTLLKCCTLLFLSVRQAAVEFDFFLRKHEQILLRQQY